MEPLTICDLPDELLVVILSYLPLLGRKCARLVCKHWYTLCESGTLAKNDVLRVRMPHELDKCTIFRRNLLISKGEEPLQDNKFLRTRGGHVKELHFHGYIEDKTQLLDLISNYIQNLQLLLLCGGCTFSGNESPILNKVRTLVLSSLDDMEGEELERLTAHAPNVSNLYFRHWFNGRPSLLPAIINLLARQTSRIHKLYLNNCKFVNEDTLKLMLNEIGPQLTGIYLYSCSLSGNAVFYPERFAHLTEIDLGRNYNLTNQCFPTIFKSLKKLRLVSLKEDKIDDSVLVLVLDLPELKGLDISGCPLLTSQGIITAFTRRSLPKMRDMRINNLCEIMTDQVVQSLCRNLPNVTHLELDNSVMTEISLTSLSLNCKLLRTLSLMGCSIISDSETPVYNLLNSFDEWEYGLGWALYFICWLIVLGCAIHQIWVQVDFDFIQKLKSAVKPSRNWGPVDPIYRHCWVQWRNRYNLTGTRDFTLKRRGTRDYTHHARTAAPDSVSHSFDIGGVHPSGDWAFKRPTSTPVKNDYASENIYWKKPEVSKH